MLLFLVVIAVFFFYDRKNVERQSILLLRKTTRGRAFLTWLGQKFPRVWWVYGNLAVIVGFIGSLFISLFLLDITMQSLTTETAPPLAVVLPSPTTDAIVAPGVIGVPFWFWIITIFVLILVHEGSHGLLAAREKVRIKSLGWGMLIALPLAFVEPDEKQLAKQGTMKQLRVYAAGSFGNIVLAIVTINIFTYIALTSYAPVGVSFQGLATDGPAAGVNLTGTIIGMEGQEIRDIFDLAAAFEGVTAGQVVHITTRLDDGGTRDYSLTTMEHPDFPDSGRGYIGILTLDIVLELKEEVPLPVVMGFFMGKNPSLIYPTLDGLLFFMYMINLGVGLFNLLPIGPLDGGRMWKLVFDRAFPKRSKAIMNGIGWLFLLIVILLFATALSQLAGGFF